MLLIYKNPQIIDTAEGNLLAGKFFGVDDRFRNKFEFGSTVDNSILDMATLLIHSPAIDHR